MASTRVDIAGASTADGARANQWDYLGGASQQWRLVWAGPNVSLGGGGTGEGGGGGRANPRPGAPGWGGGRPGGGQPSAGGFSRVARLRRPGSFANVFRKPRVRDFAPP